MDTNEIYGIGVNIMTFNLVGIVIDKAKVVGYILEHDNKPYFVTKQYGIELCYNNYIVDASVNNHINCGERLRHKKFGNRDLIRVELGKLNSLGIELKNKIDNIKTNSKIKFNKPNIIGCIFNEHGIIIGFRIKSGEEIYNAYRSDIEKFWLNRGLVPIKYLNKTANYYKYCYMYNFFIREAYGGILMRGLNLLSPNLTPRIADMLFGHENNLIDLSEIPNFLDCDIRKRVLITARKMEYNIIKNGSIYKFSKRDCKVIAKAKFKSLITNSYKSLDNWLILDVSGLVYVVVKIQHFSNIETCGIPNIDLYDGDIMYSNAYNDQDMLIITGTKCGKIKLDMINKAIEKGLTEYQFVSLVE